jgi:ribulose-5-phosphate 4-epimerase/fuculose-1-phosphate aldolase
MNVVTPAQFNTAQPRYEVSEAERRLRVELAAAFRVAHHYGWNLQILNHITARIPDRPDHFLMNPAGLGWDEITASALATIDPSGNVLSHEGVRLAPAGLNFHGGILKALPHINCVIHVHARPGVVIAATKGGLMIVDQSGCHLRILRDLGDRHCLMMWNHGLLTVGRSVGEAFQYMRRLVDACELQERLMATGAEIRTIAPEVLEFTRKQIDDKRKTPAYSDAEWQYHLRLAARLDPSFAD